MVRRAGSWAMVVAAIAFGVDAAIPNPEVDFDTILFIQITEPAGESHMCDQYLGWNARNGGGLYKLTGFREGAPEVINILANSTVQNGRFQGQKLIGGAFLSPDLDYDARRIAFAWTNEIDKCWHIFTVNVDGSNLRQITDGTATNNGNDRAIGQSQNDFDPCWLPNGRIVFVSERRGGFGRCHPRNVPTYTLYSMKDDGTDIVPISYHETNEWHPSVNNDGMLVYTRWDYLDRDDCIAHHLWTCGPDGTDPRAPHGNYPLPLTTMEGADWPDGRTFRPNGEWNIRAIPNSSKYVATGSAHHMHSYGQLIVIDPSIPDDGRMSQITNVTSTMTSWGDYWVGSEYATPWPLSENLFLCTEKQEVLLVGSGGLRTRLYATPAGRALDPIPLKPRPRPNALPPRTWQGERASLPDHRQATISIMDVTYGDMPLPAGTKISSMRILQVIPKYTPLINNPQTGYASEGLCRLSLGTVPVESDGSVYCEAPVGKEIYFQLLDSSGLAVQSMRAGTYVHAGEQMSCSGCHEDKWKATPIKPTVPIAMRRAPSKLRPEPGAETGGITPINYYRLVKPVFDAKCVGCHQPQWVEPMDFSYGKLNNYAFYFCSQWGFLNGDIKTPIRGGSRTIPGTFGARAARLTQYLGSDHHNVQLTSEERRRITLWLDGNSMEFSAYTRLDAQRRGEFVWPELDVDSANPTGVESAFPAPGLAPATRELSRIPHVRPLSIVRYGPIVKISSATDAIAQVRVFDAQGRMRAVIAGSRERHVTLDMRAIAHSRGVLVIRMLDQQGDAVGTVRIGMQ